MSDFRGAQLEVGENLSKITLPVMGLCVTKQQLANLIKIIYSQSDKILYF